MLDEDNDMLQDVADRNRRQRHDSRRREKESRRKDKER